MFELIDQESYKSNIAINADTEGSLDDKIGLGESLQWGSSFFSKS